MHWASIGWILPWLHDPDGHEVRFYTQEHHTEPVPGQVTTIHDPRETADAATNRPLPDGTARSCCTESKVEEGASHQATSVSSYPAGGWVTGGSVLTRTGGPPDQRQIVERHASLLLADV